MKPRSINTIGDCITYAVEEFTKNEIYCGHGTDNIHDEAIWLVTKTLELPRTQVIDDALLQTKISTTQIDTVIYNVRSRATKHVPTAYLAREASFADLDFYVDERVIIPRSPFAELIKNHFMPWINTDKVHNVLDMCTGSGCIAIAIAKYLENVKVDAVDLSEEALAVAKINVQAHDLKDRVQLIHSDLFNNVPRNKKYQIIISNPPYIGPEEYADMPKEYLQEPEMALVASNDGMQLVENILENAATYLDDNGILVVEVGNTESILQKTYPKIPWTWLEFQNGGHGVFLLTKEQLLDCF